MDVNSNEQFIKKAGEEYVIMKEEVNNGERGQIINEYKEQNKIDCLTEEEITDLFGESSIYPNLYQSRDGCPIIEISDYEFYMLNIGINLIENPAFNIFEESLNEDGYDLGDVEQLSENDQLYDAIEEYYADIIEKYYGTWVMSYDEYINSKLNMVVDTSITSLENSCALINSDEELIKSPSVNPKRLIYEDSYSESIRRAYEKLSKLTEDDWDYDILKREIEGLKRKEKYRKVESVVSGDMWLLRDMLYEGMSNIDLEFKYYFDEFIIIETNCGDYIEFKVYLNKFDDFNECRLLGTTRMIEYVHVIMHYWRTVGDVYDHC